MNKYDKMCYTLFIDHLKQNKIEYIEEFDIDIDYWFTEFIKVTPIECRLKQRFFNRDGGDQLF